MCQINKNFRQIIYIALILFFSSVTISSTVQAGTFTFSPASANITKQCPSRIGIYINTEGITSNSADIKINYNPAEINIIDSNPSKIGKQILPGDAYEIFVGNVVDETLGIIRLSGVSFNNNLNGSGLFAQIEFESLSTIPTAHFNIEFTGIGDTLDSNIAEEVTSNDILTGVTNGSYTFVNGNCTPDTTPPKITFQTPQNNQTGVPLNSNIIFRLTDVDSDIDLSTLIILVAGKTYTIADPAVTYTGAPNNYLVTLDPSVNLPTGIITASVTVADIVGNRAANSINFNRPHVAPIPTYDPAPRCGEACSPTNPCAGGLTCQSNVCNLIECVDKSCTCSVTLQKCNDTCTSNADCEANLNCSDGLCKITSCTGQKDCACTPPTLSCKTQVPAPIMKTSVQNVKDTITRTYDTFTPQLIKDVAKKVSVPGIASGVALLGLITNILSFLLSIRTPQLFFLWLGIFFKKNRLPWGIIMDASTGEPLSYASIRIYLKGTKALVSQRITDTEGRYSMVLPAGKYRMEIEHTRYIKQEVQIFLENDNDIIPNDIALKPLLHNEKKYIWFSIRPIFTSINNFLTEHILFLIYFGLATSILAVIITPILYNFVMLGLYGIATLLYIFKKDKRIEKWGEVIDAQSDLKIPYIMIKLFDRTTWKMVDTQLTNQRGSFGLFNEPGEYAILAVAKGYSFPSDRQTDMKRVKDKIGLLELNIHEGQKLSVKLFVDPLRTQSNQITTSISDNTTQDSQGIVSNLASPFK